MNSVIICFTIFFFLLHHFFVFLGESGDPGGYSEKGQETPNSFTETKENRSWATSTTDQLHLGLFF
jgi:hypothetical protein